MGSKTVYLGKKLRGRGGGGGMHFIGGRRQKITIVIELIWTSDWTDLYIR